MFTKIRLRNFKAWGEQLWEEGLELAPLTVFLGTNSSGKSSLLQPLRLWQQTVVASDMGTVLNFGGDHDGALRHGAYREVVHRHDTTQTLGFGLETWLREEHAHR